MSDLSSIWKTQLQMNYATIVKSTTLEGDVLDSLFEKGFVSQEERELITESERTTSNKNSVLLDIISKKDKGAFEYFLSCLKENGYEDIVKEIKDTQVSIENKSPVRFSEAWKEKILSTFKCIVHGSDLEKLLNDLYSQKCFSSEEKEMVQKVSPNTIFEKNRKVLKMLLHKSKKEFDIFLKCLKKVGRNDLANKIQNADTENPSVYEEESDEQIIDLKRKIFVQFQQLVEHGSSELFLDDFVSARIFDISDMENIQNAVPNTHKGKTAEFLDTLLRGPLVGIQLYMSILKREGHQELISTIQGTSTTNFEKIDNDLKIRYSSSPKSEKVPSNIREQARHYVRIWKEKPYVKVKSTGVAEEVARQKCVVTITGNAGCGKTATIRNVALKFEKEGYEVLPVSSFKEMMQYLDTRYKQVFVFDDPVGNCSLEMKKLEKWLYHTDLLSNLPVENSKILCSIRYQIFTDKDFTDSKSVLGQNSIDLGDEKYLLTQQEKIEILEKHLEGISFVLSDEIKNAISSVNDYFPLLCAKFATSKDFRKQGSAFFTRPIEILLEEVKHIYNSSRIQYCILVLCFLMRNNLSFGSTPVGKKKKIIDQIKNACNVSPNTPFESLKEQIHHLIPVYLKRDGFIYKFNHELIHDVIAYHFGSTKQEHFLKHAPSEFIRNRVAIGKFENGDSLMISIKEENISELVDRLVSDVEIGVFNETVLNSCWDDDRVIQSLAMKLSKKKKHRILDAFCKPCKTVKEEKDKNMVDTLSWYLMAKQCLNLPEVSALHWIVVFGRAHLFNAIWKHLNSIQRKQLMMRLPLTHFACLGGNVEICKTLLNVKEANAYINAQLQINGQIVIDIFPIHCAVMKNADVLDVFLNHGAKVNQQTDKASFTPLLYATVYGNIDAARRLLSRDKIKVDLCTSTGLTPLIVSVQNNHTEITKLLLENHANVKHEDERGWTALHFASKYNNIEAVRLLIRYKADVNQSDIKNRSPLFLAVQEGFAAMTSLLLSENANVNTCNLKGNSPLHIVAENDDISIAKLLFQERNEGSTIEIDKRNEHGNSPLQIAVKHKRYNMAKLLLHNKANVNLPDNDTRSPLLIAVLVENVDLTKLLLQHGAEIDSKSKLGNSPLHIAVQNNNLGLAELLLKQKADVHLVDNCGKSPLLKAVEKQNYEMVKLLVGYFVVLNQPAYIWMTPTKDDYMNKYDHVNRLLQGMTEYNRSVSSVKEKQILLRSLAYYFIKTTQSFFSSAKFRVLYKRSDSKLEKLSSRRVLETEYPNNGNVGYQQSKITGLLGIMFLILTVVCSLLVMHMLYSP